MEIIHKTIEDSSGNSKVEENSEGDEKFASKNDEFSVKVCENDSEINSILNHITNSPAIFQSQQIGDPELPSTVKRKIAEDVLQKNPVTFLCKFGKFLNEEHLNYFLNKYSESYEVSYHIKHLKTLLSDHHRRIIKKNRRYEAMKKLEAEGSYFSEAEMEKREPLLYHEMVGQFLSEKEKHIKNREQNKNKIPTFSSFLIDKIERDELDEMVKSQLKEEESLEDKYSSSENESDDSKEKQARWGEDWDEKLSSTKVERKKPKKQKKVHISSKEKDLLLQEFKSIMQNKFLNGKDDDFNYSDVDHNPEYDSIELRGRDEEEKYFDEETLDDSVCTDTGIEDY